jgi:replicative DNA helicase
MSASTERLPPQDIEAEMSVLGALLLGDTPRSEEAAAILKPEEFYRDAHGRIFRAMSGLLARREPIDIVTTKNALDAEGILDAVGGLGYLIQLGEFVPTTASLPHYAKIVKQKATLRRLIELAGEVAGQAYLNPDEAAATALIEHAERAILALRPTAPNSGPRRALEIASELFEEIEARQAAGGGLIGESTGFPALDWFTSGLVPGNLYIVAARPSMGKTSAAVNLAASVVRSGGRVAFFSMEMSASELVENVLTAEAPVDGHRLRQGRLSGEEWGRVSGRVLDDVTLQLYVDDSTQVTPAYIRAACRKLVAGGGPLSAIFIDYIQLMGGGGSAEWGAGERVAEVSHITRGLKLLAREFNVPVIALSQLNRKLESREDKRPMLSDLRESGSIEQDADVVLFLYRPSYYARKEEASEETERERFEPDETEFIFAKNRKGQTGVARLGFIPAYRRFVPFSSRDDAP